MMRTMILAPLAAATLLGAACGSDASNGADTASNGGIGATLDDSSIVLAATSAPAGAVSLDIANDGSTVHEFELLRTDIAADALPVDSGVVQTSAQGIEIVDEVEDISPATTATLSVELGTGDYVVICNVAGHYEAGMSASFTVT